MAARAANPTLSKARMTKYDYESLTPRDKIFAVLAMEILKELKGINQNVEAELTK